jgi:cell wall assembly regulator SMI1
MRDIWKRIDTQFAALAPEILEHLGPPVGGASEGEIARLEGILGLRLPEDVRESWAVHNGTGFRPLGDGTRLSNLEQIADNWAMMRELLEGGEFDDSDPDLKPKGPIRVRWWNLRWVPITDNGSGNYLCLDLDPAEGGTPGQLIDWDHERGPTKVIATGLREYLGRFADDLEAGRLHFGRTGVVRLIG